MHEKFKLLPGSLLIGLSGGITAQFMVEDFWFSSFIFLIASVAGACTIVFFGRRGAVGWAWALWGGVLATVGASGLFGALIAPHGYIELPMMVGQHLWEYPSSGVLWFVFMGLAHLITLRLREI